MPRYTSYDALGTTTSEYSLGAAVGPSIGRHAIMCSVADRVKTLYTTGQRRAIPTDNRISAL